MARPLDVAHSLRNNALIVTWADESRSELPIPLLRGWCPCAGCQGHGDVIRYHAADESVTAVALDEVGAYALGIRFSDGHDSGIFSWTWLRRLADHQRAATSPGGSFRAGTFHP